MTKIAQLRQQAAENPLTFGPYWEVIEKFQARLRPVVDLDTGAVEDEIDRLECQVHNLEIDISRMRKAATAYRDLATCYRLNKQPSEKLFERLAEADKLFDGVKP